MKRTFVLGAAILFAALFAMPAAAQKQNLSDAEIASISVAANNIDIDAAKLAKSKSTNSEVLQFAQTMATDHKAVLDKAVALVTKLGVTPKDNAVTKQLLANAKKTANSLKSKSGHAFDAAYINNEVAYHKAVIALMNSRLIPEASNADLKNLLESVGPAFKAHLEHAEMLQKKIK